MSAPWFNNMCPKDDGVDVRFNYRWFTVKCDWDNYSEDTIAQVTSSTYDGCIDSCARTAACISSVYISTTKRCYLKRGYIPGRGDSNRMGVVLTRLENRPIVCPDASYRMYRDANDQQFQVTCNQDYYGNDISNSPASSIETCLAQCPTVRGCVGVNYYKGICYLKSARQTYRNKPSVTWAAYAASTTDPRPVSTAGADVPIVCDRDDGRVYKDTNNRVYRISCGFDSAYNDISNSRTPTIEACLTRCDQTTGCGAAAYRNGACYLKTGAFAYAPNAGVVFAEYIK